MKTLWQTSLTAACAALLAVTPVVAQPKPVTDEGARAVARTLIADTLEKRVVRPVAPARIEAEAERIAASLSEDQVQALVESRDAAPVLAERTRAAAASQPLAVTSAKATSAKALGDAESDLVFVPLAPCRIIDTRQISAGALGANETRHFLVAGSNAFLAQGGTGGGCGVPDGVSEPAAPAVVINFIAVGPAGPGNLRAWEYGQPVPRASVINYANVPGLNIANGVVVPIEGTSLQPADLSIRSDVSSTHVVADVTGYFTRFPLEQFSPKRDIMVVANQPNPTDLSSGACQRITTCTVTSPPNTTGKVVIRSQAQVSLNHTQGTHDRVTVGSKLGTEVPANCTAINDQVANMDFELPDIHPTSSDVDVTITHGRDFPQPGGVTRTYSLLSNMIIGASTGDQIESARMICTFIAD
jgi:hypothetical protein